MGDRRSVDDLSIEELERILVVRRRQEREKRLRYLGRGQQPDSDLLVSLKTLEPPAKAEAASPPTPAEPPASTGRRGFSLRRVRDSSLLLLEIGALVGLIVVLLASVFNLQVLNQEVALAREPQPTATATPQVQMQIAQLPGGHTPPTSRDSVPQRLADKVQPVVPVPIPTPGPQSATRIVIPSINVDATVVEGDDWEQLKKGAAHHIGSANPGERGNCFISAHNDIFGEIFRDLEKVELEDEITVYAGETAYRYIVKAKRVTDPTDVSVMASTASPILTLMTCYPYMIDTHRLVVIAELAD